MVDHEEPTWAGHIFTGWTYNGKPVTAILLNGPVTFIAAWEVEEPIKIVQQPADCTIQPGESATFSVVALGEGLTYLWQYKLATDDTWVDWTSKTKPSISVAYKANRNGMKLRCYIQDNAGNELTSGEVTLTYVVPQYLVTYDAGEGVFASGEHTDTVEVSMGEYVLDHEKPALDGHVFVGWTLNGDLVNTLNIDGSTENYTVVASWRELGEITVTFHANGGYFGDDPDVTLVTRTCPEGTALLTVDETIIATHPDGLVFLNYYLDAEGTELADVDTYVLTEDVDLYIKWGEPGKIVCHANGGRVDFFGDGTWILDYYRRNGAIGGEYRNLEGMLVTNERTFLGWYYEPECINLAAEPGGSFTLTQAEVHLYAKWAEAAGHTVTFDANPTYGGHVSYRTYDQMSFFVPEGRAIGFYINVENDSGKKELAGWNLAADGSGDAVDLDTYVPNADVTIYAQWVDNGKVEIIFDANGGTFSLSNNEDQSVITGYFDSGDTIYGSYELRYDPVGSMVVVAWYDNPACTGDPVMEGDSGIRVTEDMHLYAQWVEGWTVTLDANGGWFWEDENQTTLAIVAQKGRAIHDYFEPGPHDGLAFAGWNTSADGTGDWVDLWDYTPAGHVTLYAQWVTGVTVTFDYNGRVSNFGETTCEKTVALGDCVYGNYFEIYNFNEGMMVTGWYLDANCTELAMPSEGGTYYPSTDVILYAKWEEAWTVTYDANGYGLWGSMDYPSVTYMVVKGMRVYNQPGTEPLNGVAFAGWYLDADCTGDPIEPYDYVPTGDVTFYAKWEEAQLITVTFHANDGTFERTGDVKTYAEIIALGDSVSGDYWFVNNFGESMKVTGWYLDPECTQLAMLSDWSAKYTPEGDVTLYAKWAECWTVTFDANGGLLEGYEVRVRSSLVVKGDPISEWLGAINEGLAFAGWYLNAEGTGDQIDPWSYVPTSDVTLYAKWEAGITVTFDANGRAFERLENQTTYVETVASGEYIGGGYWFIYNFNEGMMVSAWYDNPACDGEPVVTCRSSFSPTQDITLYAKWSEYWTVTLDGNGGHIYEQPDLTEEHIYVPKGEQMHFSPYMEPQNGMAFAGWYLNAEVTGEQIDLPSYVPTGDVTLYAKWSECWNVTFDANGGYFWAWGDPDMHTLTVAVAKGQAVQDNPDVDHPNGLAFVGWYLNAEGTGDQIDTWNYIPTGDVTFYAKWVSWITVTFDANGRIFERYGTDTHILCVAPGDQVYGYDEFLLYNFDEHMIVSGWYLDPACSDLALAASSRDARYYPSEDVTLYAKWEEAWCVSFDPNGGWFWDDMHALLYRCMVLKGDSPIIVPDANPMNGMVFAGWYLDAACTGDPVDVESYVPTADVTFYAKWVEDALVAEINGTNFPDDAFRVYVSNNFDRNGDGVLSNAEINAVTQINVRDMGIASLQGIEYFTALQFLDCGCNNLTELDLSGNSALTCLDCDGNSITSLNVSGCTELDTIFCGNNQLTALDVSSNNRLENLHFNNNYGITSVDLSNKTALKQISAYATGLTSLDVSACSRVIQALENATPSVAWDGHLDYELQVNDDEYVARIDPGLTVIGANPVMPNGYTVTFDANGGQIDGSDETTWSTFVSQGGELQAEPNVTNEDLAFAGWYLDTNFEGDPIMPWGYVPTGDMTFYAKWAEGVMVTFDANGGYFWDPNETTWSIRTPKGATCTVYGRGPGEPKRDDGQVFAGWYDNAACTGDPVDPWNYMPTYQTDVTFYAKWRIAEPIDFEISGYAFFEDGKSFEVDRGNGNAIVFDYNGLCLFGNFEFSRELVAEDLPWYHSGQLYDANGNTINTDSKYADCGRFNSSWDSVLDYSELSAHGIFAVDIPDDLADGTYTYELQLTVNGQTHTDTVVFTYSAARYTVTFHANGGYFGDDPTQTVYIDTGFRPGETIGTVAVQHNDPSMRFMGWYLDPGCTEFVCFGEDGYEPRGDMTLYAKWGSFYRVTFDANGGYLNGNPEITTVVFLVPTGASVDPDGLWASNANENVAFSGWYLNADGTGERVDDIWNNIHYTSTDDVTLYAKWGKNCHVVFDLNGGHLDFESTTGYYVAEGTYLYFQGTPDHMQGGLVNDTDPDLVITDWYFDQACTEGPVDIGTYIITDDVTLYAKWGEQITITYNANGGYFGDDPTQTTLVVDGYRPSEARRLIALDLHHSDPSLRAVDGWYMDPECQMPMEYTYGYPLCSMTLYARWAPGYTVTFDANGGYFGEDPEVTLDYLNKHINDSIYEYEVIRDVSHADPHMCFIGWCLDAACEQPMPEDYLPNGDVTLYAKWVVGNVVTFDANGGQFYCDGSGFIGPEPTRTFTVEEGYAIGMDSYTVIHSDPHLALEGWYLDEDLTQFAMGRGYDDSYVPTSDATLYAKWVEGWAVTFNANGGYFNIDGYPTTSKTFSVIKGEAFGTSMGAFRDGGIMSDGWYLDANCTGDPVNENGFVPTQDTVLYAGWTPEVRVSINASNFPDDTFRGYIAANLDNGDGILSDAEINAVTQISVRDMGIASLQGIEYFTALQFLDCGGNNLTELDLSGNSALTCLDCDGNSITSLNVSGCTELDTIFCGNNQLTALDVSNNNRLENLHFNNNHGITSVDLSNKTALKQISAYATGLTSLDVSACSRVIQALENATPSVAWDGHLDYELQVNDDEYVARIDPGLTVIGANPVMPNGYTVTFDANGGYMDYNDPNVTTCLMEFEKNNPTMCSFGVFHSDHHKVLDGWYYDAACTRFAFENDGPFTLTEDVTLYANWIDGWMVTFQSNGGLIFGWDDMVEADYCAVRKGSPVEYRPETINTDSSMFVGWYFDSDGTGEPVELTEYVPTGDVTLYAKWAAPCHVTFNANGGYLYGYKDITVDTIVIPFGQLISNYFVPDVQNDDPAVVFFGWYDNSECTGEPVHLTEYVPTGDVTLYAKWVALIAVTYDANGGYFQDDPTFTSFTNTVAAGASATGAFWSYEYNSTDHTMVGGWYYDPECTQFVMGPLGSFIPTEDVTLYAKWVAAAVITYDANGGYLYGNPSVSISDGYHMPIGQPMYGNNVLSADREGYTFAGWCLDASGTGDVVDMYNYTPTADVTFYAKWIDLVNVTFNANGGLLIFGDGEFSVRTVQIEKGSPLNCIGIPITRREGMALEGWYLDADFQNGPINEDTYVFTSDVTFYAKWAESWTVTFNGNGGYIWGQSEVPTYSVSVIRGGVVEYVPSVEHPDGLTFAGWYDNAACTGDAVDVYTCIITGDVTFYAKWVSAEPEPETYTVTWDGNGGYFDNEHTVTFVTEQVIAGNATTMNPYVESADGTAVVENWYFNPECTGTPVFTGPGGYTPTADITIYAKLTYTYKVLMNPNGGYILDGSNEIWANIREDRAFYGSDYVNLFGHSNPNMIIEGWYFDAACTNLACSCIEGDEIRFFYPTEAVTVYAKWVNNTVTVVFDANGGYFNGNETDTRMTGYRQRGSVLDSNIPNILSRPGWDLAEDPWYLDAACTNGPVDLSTYVLNNDVTFYAKWIEVEPEAQPDGLMSNLDRGAANVPGEGNEEDENGILVTEEDDESAADADETESSEPAADAGVIEGNEPAADAGETEGNEPVVIIGGQPENDEPSADDGSIENVGPAVNVGADEDDGLKTNE